MSRVAVVGAGIAGVACARALNAGRQEVTVIDRARAAGGRMSSQRLGSRTADTGAQYATASERDFTDLMRGWVDRGLAREWADGFSAWADGELAAPHGGVMRYTAPGGMQSLVADLATGLELRLQTQVGSISAGTGTTGPAVDGEPYDAVVLAMPDPQALRLLSEDLPAERAAVADHDWEAVLSLTTTWARHTWPSGFDAAFVNGEGTLAWIANDGSRRGDGAAVLVSHSTGPFAAVRLEDPAAAGPAMLEATKRVLGIAASPTDLRVQRWTYARPAGKRPEPFYLGAARVGLCGDGWGTAKVETAWVSGTALARALLARLD